MNNYCTYLVLALICFFFSCYEQKPQKQLPLEISQGSNLSDFIKLTSQNYEPVRIQDTLCHNFIIPAIQKIDLFTKASEFIAYTGQLEMQNDSFALLSFFYESKDKNAEIKANIIANYNISLGTCTNAHILFCNAHLVKDSIVQRIKISADKFINQQNNTCWNISFQIESEKQKQDYSEKICFTPLGLKMH